MANATVVATKVRNLATAAAVAIVTVALVESLPVVTTWLMITQKLLHRDLLRAVAVVRPVGGQSHRWRRGWRQWVGILAVIRSLLEQDAPTIELNRFVTASVMALTEHWPDQSDWSDHLQTWFDSQTARVLSEFVDQQRQDETVFPPADSVFNAFRLTSWSNTKVVILGQDPYHGPGQAHGLSFSVGQTAERFPPSLRNIFKELASDLGGPIPETSNLEPWARQGVLLLNTVLTVRSGEAHSHKNRGWESFTDAVIESFNSHAAKIVFLLWGKSAQKKVALIDDRHIQLAAPHPSPLSAHRGFFGSRPFSKTNEMLVSQGRDPIDWLLE